MLAGEMTAAGHEVELLDAAAVRAEVDSPTYLGGLRERHGTALVEPARLAWGLRRACLAAGVTIHERTRVSGLARDGAGLRVATADGPALRAGRVALATNAFPPLLRRLRLATVPVYDHVLMTEPLSPAQLASVGWAGRQGIGDAANRFHYYRLTRDDRILWGGYDATYHYGSRIAPALEQRDATHERLAEHFFTTFPQLAGLGFTHRWGGVIDTCTRFAAFYGTAYAGRAAYALGYTGLGVAASRFGAQVLLDRLDGADTERTRLRMVRERAAAVPPGAAALGRRPADRVVAGPRRRAGRPAQRLAARARPRGAGLRLDRGGRHGATRGGPDGRPTAADRGALARGCALVRQGRAARRRARPRDGPGDQAGPARVGGADVDDVVAGAAEAGRAWGAASLTRRTAVLFAFREALSRRRREVAEAITAEHGKVLDDALGEVQRGLEVVEFACGAPHLLKGGFSDGVSTGVDVHSLRQPLGVVAVISPFNFPAMVPLWFVPVAIACGNAVVLKPQREGPVGLAGAGRAVGRGRSARRRLQRRPRRQGGRRRAAGAPGGGGGVVRRLDADRAVRLRDRHPARQAGAGAGRREEPHGGAAGRRPRGGRGRRGQRRVRLGGGALHGDLGRGRGRPGRRRAGADGRERGWRGCAPGTGGAAATWARW